MNHSLKPWNTFGIDHNAQHIVCAEDEQQLLNAWQHATAKGQPVLILGEGSNVLFLEDYRGTVIINRIKGIEIHDEPDAWYLHVGAGENWHRLVKYTLQEGMPGLENLALIPGCVGSSPIQNIGAYGVELQRVCAYVDCVELATGKQVRLTAKECRFGYRDSIFKHEYQDRFAIVFKNPVVSAETAKALLAQFPTAPNYPQADGSVKLAAGWLIDQCQLKGMQMGGAAVHRQQALVLINEDNAKSEDVVQLAHYVRQKVGEKFNVWLEPEVRVIGASGEVSAVETIS